MDLATIANVATALTLLAGVGFGLVEAHRARRAREERATFNAVQAILTPEWMKSMVVVHNIPERVLDSAQAVGVILEGVGYSVMRGLFLYKWSEISWAAPCAWPGGKCVSTLKKNAAGAVHGNFLNGSNGSPHNWSVIPQEKPACRSVRMKHTAIGNRVDEHRAKPVAFAFSREIAYSISWLLI